MTVALRRTCTPIPYIVDLRAKLCIAKPHVAMPAFSFDSKLIQSDKIRGTSFSLSLKNEKKFLFHNFNK